MSEFVTRILDLARAATGMQLAWVSRFSDDRQVFGYVVGESERFGLFPGGSSPLCDSYCFHVSSGDLPRDIPDTMTNPTTSAMAVTRQFGLGSYVGTPIVDEAGKQIGMLCAVSDHPRSALHDDVLHQLDMLASIVGIELRQAERLGDETAATVSQIKRWTRGHGLDTHLQPIVDLHSGGRPSGFEALSRFSPALGNPAECFAVAWLHGLGAELELAAIERAVQHLDEIPEHAYLSVNVSPHADVLGRVTDVVPAHLLSRIIVEVTEHTAITDYDEVSTALDAARTAGIRIAVDDAGAGYASFRHVLQLRPDFIKLDLSLTRDIDTDIAKQALVGSWVGLADSTGATLVAEGVETPGEHATLARLGVQSAQGYLFAKPAPVETLSDAGILGAGWTAFAPA